MIDEETQPGVAATPESSGSAVPYAAHISAPVERWLRDYGDVLWRFALSRTHSREVAEDVVQETMLAAMQAFASFTSSSSERTWLLGIAAHKVADHFRGVRRRARSSQTFGAEKTATDTSQPAGEFTFEGMWAKPPSAWGLKSGRTSEDAEILAALRHCIDALPPSLAEVVWLRDLLCVPGGEVCKAMGISPTNLWSRASRARALLRTCVENAISQDKEGAP